MRISMRRCPPTTPLFLDYLENWPQVQKFYPQSYTLDSIENFARSRARLDSGHTRELCSVLSEQQTFFGAGQRGVDKLASGAVAVVTGQQPVLFTGPLFSIFKAISAVKIAQRLEAAGIPAVPIFWIASEDHDFEEIQSTWLINGGELCRVSVNLSTGQPIPAGWLKYGSDVRDAVQHCLSSVPHSEFIPDLKSVLEEAYQPGSSPVAAFGKMIAKLFAGTELILLDPLHDRLRRLAQSVIEKAIAKNAAIRAAVAARNKALTASGYHEQVKVDQNFTGLFAFRGQLRQPLRPLDLGPGVSWSPNVLLRPVVQDTILPTVTYVGGPAEVAYFAQAAAVYEALDKPMAPIFPRISATLLERRLVRIFEKYKLSLEDVFQGQDHLKIKVVGQTEEDQVFAQVSEQVRHEMDRLDISLRSADATLAGALETSRKKVLYQIESLHGRYVRAAVRKNDLLGRHLELLSNTVYPDKKPQERVLNISSFIARYGLDIVSRLTDQLSLDSTQHQVVEL